MSVRTTIEDETAKIYKYNKKMPTIAHVLNEDLRQQKEQQEQESPASHASPADRKCVS